MNRIINLSDKRKEKEQNELAAEFMQFLANYAMPRMSHAEISSLIEAYEIDDFSGMYDVIKPYLYRYRMEVMSV